MNDETLTGREFLEKLWAGQGAAPLGLLLGMRLVEVGDGNAVFEGIPEEKYYNPGGRVHGGWIATILDSALGCAVHSILGRGVRYGTVELKVNYVRPIFASTGKVICRARVVHPGRRMQTAEGRLEDEAGKLYAHGSGTFMTI